MSMRVRIPNQIPMVILRVQIPNQIPMVILRVQIPKPMVILRTNKSQILNRTSLSKKTTVLKVIVRRQAAMSKSVTEIQILAKRK